MLTPVAWLLAPVTFALGATVQVYCVPAGTTSEPPVVAVNAVPEQIVAVLFATTGVGLTVIV